MRAPQLRSAAARHASRVNGAKSKGPRSAAGKLASAGNALRHGLFRASVVGHAVPSPPVAELAAELEKIAARCPGARLFIEQAVAAAIQLEQAGVLVARVRSDIDALLAAEPLDAILLAERVRELVRYGRYERRFAGCRDRALRNVLRIVEEA